MTNYSDSEGNTPTILHIDHVNEVVAFTLDGEEYIWQWGEFIGRFNFILN